MVRKAENQPLRCLKAALPFHLPSSLKKKEEGSFHPMAFQSMAPHGIPWYRSLSNVYKIHSCCIFLPSPMILARSQGISLCMRS